MPWRSACEISSFVGWSVRTLTLRPANTSVMFGLTETATSMSGARNGDVKSRSRSPRTVGPWRTGVCRGSTDNRTVAA